MCCVAPVCIMQVDSDSDSDRDDAAYAQADNMSDAASLASGAPRTSFQVDTPRTGYTGNGGHARGLDEGDNRNDAAVPRGGPSSPRKPGVAFQPGGQQAAGPANGASSRRPSFSADALLAGSGRRNSSSGAAWNNGGGAAALLKQKCLTHTKRDLLRLTLPFLVWAVTMLILYAATTVSLTSVGSKLVDLKLLERSMDQASRTIYYAAEVALATVRTPAGIMHLTRD